MDNKRYDISLEVITPLSIGAGNDNDWYCGADYIISDNKVYIIDITKASQKGIDLNQLSNLFVRQNVDGIKKLLGNNLENISNYIFDAPANTNNPIKSFLRTQMYGMPLVAGSSLKGAIRSTLFKFLRDGEDNNQDVFGQMKDGTDFMRFIRVGDIELSHTELLNSKIFNLTRDNTGQWTGGWKHERDSTTTQFKRVGFNTLYECALPGEKGIGTITFANNAYALLLHSYHNSFISHADKKEEVISKGLEFLFEIVNRYTREYLKKEKRFFEKYHADRSDEILSNIEYLLDIIPEDNSYCLLKMSAGTGFHSITGDWQYDSYDNTGYWSTGKKKFKSRKTAEYKNKLCLMGFVKISILKDSELEARQNYIDESHKDIVKKHLNDIQQKEKLANEAIEKQKRELERIEEEKKIKEKKAQEDLEKKKKEETDRKKESELISEAYQLKQTKEYKKALEKYKEAEDFGFNSYAREINECELAIKDDGNNSGDIEGFLSQIIKLASIPAFAGRLKKRKEKVAITEDDIIKIADFIKKKLNEDKKLSKTWKNDKWDKIEEVITKELSDKLYALIFG